MTRRKKLITYLIISILIIISFFIGNIFARYITRLRGKGIAKIATWNFRVNGTREEVQNIELFSKNDRKSEEENKMAPGTQGDFEIIIDAKDSEVEISYNIEFLNETEKPRNLKFIYEGKEYKSILELNGKMNGIIKKNEKEKVKRMNIKWEWKYQTGDNEEEIQKNDLIDTEDVMKLKEYNFEVIVTGRQVNA